jgi:uncharacterized protein (TIGR02058 family)
MALVRCITEMGMGVDVHGLDDTLAAKRAVCDAMHHSSLGFARLVGATADDRTVHVLIGVPHSEQVNADEVAAALPHGHAAVQVVAGGLERHNEDGRDGTLIANAIITVSMDDGTEGRGRPRSSALLPSPLRPRGRHRRPDASRCSSHRSQHRTPGSTRGSRMPAPCPCGRWACPCRW